MNSPPQREKTPKRRVCVLYAEDDRLPSVAIARVLTVTGFKVETAANGQEAPRNLLSHAAAYEFILTDHAMPLLTGEEWLRNAREDRFAGRVIVYAASCLIPWPRVCGNWAWSASSTRRRACIRSWKRWVNC